MCIIVYRAVMHFPIYRLNTTYYSNYFHKGVLWVNSNLTWIFELHVQLYHVDGILGKLKSPFIGIYYWDFTGVNQGGKERHAIIKFQVHSQLQSMSSEI